MGERRFLARVAGGGLLLEEEEAHHARRVLRLAPGAVVTCFDGEGNAWSGRIAAYEGGRAIVEILERLPVEAEPAVPVRLALGLLKGDKLDFVVQKATELGAASLLPIETERSERRTGFEKRLVRLRRIAVEAAKQCERNRVLAVLPPMTLSSAITQAGDSALALVERAARPLRTVLRSVPPAAGVPLTVFVGPEGGWSAAEYSAFTDAGIPVASLGSRILRAETAALAVLAVLDYEL
jgi:16S rRNA (uracil1498-N3)-methyltransferase